MAPENGLTLIIAEDDDDDFLLTVAAMEEAEFSAEVVRVKDGEELMDYLLRRGRYQKRARHRTPLVLLDLNMPRKDGREALREIKANPALRRIPVVVLTTSRAQEDVVRAYELGVSSFLRKPSSFEQFVAYVRILRQYWLETVELPAGGGT